MSVKIKSLKLISVNNKVQKIIGRFQRGFFFGISDLRLADNCLKMTVYDVIGGNESKTVILLLDT